MSFVFPHFMTPWYQTSGCQLKLPEVGPCYIYIYLYLHSFFIASYCGSSFFLSSYFNQGIFRIPGQVMDQANSILFYAKYFLAHVLSGAYNSFG